MPGMMVYSGRATLDDGDRQETVEVSISGMIAPAGEGTRADTTWEGRILSNCAWEHWMGRVVTIRLPDGRSGLVSVSRSGRLSGIGPTLFAE
jgi:hypothetical protein